MCVGVWVWVWGGEGMKGVKGVKGDESDDVSWSALQYRVPSPFRE